MKVLHLTGSISRKAGGLFYSVRRLAQEQLAQGCDVEVVGLEDEFSSVDAGLWSPLKPHVIPVKIPAFWGYAPRLKEKLDELKPDVVHLHGLWLYNSHLLSRWADSAGVKYVVSPRGMLDAWALKNAGWKKKIAGALYEKRNLNRADCVHALTEKESVDIRAYGVGSDICVVPNGVDVQGERLKVEGCRLNGWGEVAEVAGGEWQVAEGMSKARVLLYIGRLHPKKGLENLIKAWTAVRLECDEARSWKLIVAGWDDGGYERKLKSLVADLEMGNDICFAGPVYGDAKDELLRNADAFILPSLSEGLPMSVLEAWAYGLPVLMTKECNLPGGFDQSAAIEVALQAESIAAGIRRIIKMSVEERAEMGRSGRKLVVDQYAWPKVAQNMISVYSWIIDGQAKPDCLR